MTPTRQANSFKVVRESMLGGGNMVEAEGKGKEAKGRRVLS